MVAIDAKQGIVHTRAGTVATEWRATDWARRAEELGAGEILFTSMDRDGQQTGYDLKLTSAIAKSVSIPVIASGGAGIKQDFLDALQMGASAVLAASLFHDGVLNIAELKTFLRQNGQEIRL